MWILPSDWMNRADVCGPISHTAFCAIDWVTFPCPAASAGGLSPATSVASRGVASVWVISMISSSGGKPEQSISWSLVGSAATPAGRAVNA
jgi:hypothetical protein